MTVRFYVAAFVSGSVYPVLAPNTTYYFNIKSANPADNPGAADMFVDASFG